MKPWKRILTVLLCLCALGAAAGFSAGATEISDKNTISNQAIDYVVGLQSYLDMCVERDLKKGTVAEYAEGLDQDPAEVWFNMDGEERSLEELCRDLRFYGDLAEESSLINEIFRGGPMENYTSQCEIQDVTASGDYGRVELKLKRKFNYPETPDAGADTEDTFSVEFLRLDGTWYIASCSSNYFSYQKDTRSMEYVEENIQYMKDNKEQLIAQQRQNRIDGDARKIHDDVPGKLAKIMQVVKRTAYKALGVERQQAFR